MNPYPYSGKECPICSEVDYAHYEIKRADIPDTILLLCPRSVWDPGTEYPPS